MPTVPSNIRPLLAGLRAALDALYGDRLAWLVLYGSQALGNAHAENAHAESDVDVLVVLEGPVQPGREIRRMRRVRTKLGLKHERALSLLPVSASEYQSRSSVWLQNVHQEGMKI